MPACGLRCGSSWGPVLSSFVSSTSRPSRGASLVGRTTGSFLMHGLVRQAREEAERSRRGTSRGAHDASHDDRSQAGAGLRSPCFLFGAKGASAGKSIKQRQPFWCNKTKTSRTAGWRSSWSPGRRHRQSLWQPKTNFSQDKCTRCSPSKWPIVGALPAQYLGRAPGPLPINRTSHPQGRGI